MRRGSTLRLSCPWRKSKRPLWEGAHPTLPRAGNPLVAHRASQRGQSGEHSIASDIDEGKPFLSADGDGLHQAALYEQTPLGDAARASLARDIRDLGAAVDNIAAAGKASRQPVKMLGRRAAASLPTHGLCGSSKKMPAMRTGRRGSIGGTSAPELLLLWLSPPMFPTTQYTPTPIRSSCGRRSRRCTRRDGETAAPGGNEKAQRFAGMSRPALQTGSGWTVRSMGRFRAAGGWKRQPLLRP